MRLYHGTPFLLDILEVGISADVLRERVATFNASPFPETAEWFLDLQRFHTGMSGGGIFSFEMSIDLMAGYERKQPIPWLYAGSEYRAFTPESCANLNEDMARIIVKFDD